MSPSPDKIKRNLFDKVSPALLMLGIFLFGGIILGYLLNWGEIPFNILDWSQEGPRYLFLKNSLQEGKLPLFIDSPMVETDRFLGIPDTLLVPQGLLLFFVPIGQFVLINVFINYAVGFYFLIRLKQRLGWSLTTFLLVAPLMTLNGFILSHLAVGHSMWVNAFLLPWLALLCISFNQTCNKTNWRWVLQFSLFSLVVFLQGGYHFALWSWGFVLILSLNKPSTIKTGVLSVLFAALVSMIRILPASVTYYDTDRLFIAGFRSLDDLVRSITQLQLPEQSQILMNNGLPNWETNFYIGLLGGLFLFGFGLVLPIIRNNDLRKRFDCFWIPMLIMSVLSLGQIFRFTNFLPFPLAHAERVSSRFFVIPFLLLIVIAGDTFNRWWSGSNPSPKKWLMVSGAVVVILHDLAQNARLWRVDRLQTLFENFDVPVIGNTLTQQDPSYINAIVIGIVISVTTLILLWFLTRKNKLQAANQDP